VPLDPAYPAERLAYMLSDSAPVALVTQGVVEGLPTQTLPTVVLEADGNGPSLMAQPDGNPVVVGLTAQHLAYVIYTSGSTGQPKGVMIEHANAANFIGWALAHFDGEQLAQTLCSTSLSFDLAVFELFAPLSAGGVVRVVKDALAAGPVLGSVSLINTVPSAMQALLEYGPIPPSVRTVNLAGEPLRQALVERIFASSAVDCVANLYGPSETTTYSTWVRMDRATSFVPHIGRPIANTRIYILDAIGQPVPIGVTGEIHIGGAGVARGYLHRPELTAERFVPDPFSSEADARMYRTGDLGRFRADGAIEYLGRNDFQVKIRGFRIELGEIEAALGRCAGVREAVVVAREDIPGDRRLVAYVAAPDEAKLTTRELRASLAMSLAEYMIPGVIVVQPALPRTPNGKIDRAALTLIDSIAATNRPHEAPSGDVERAVADIWKELLQLPDVGRFDHFFEAGGHSLLVLRLVARLREEFGVEVSLRYVFEHPELADIADHVIELQIASYYPEDVERIECELDTMSEAELTEFLSGNGHA